MAIDYWDLIAKNFDFKLISERQLRNVENKGHHSKKQQYSVFRCFLNWNKVRVINADKMMNHPKGRFGIISR